ncbi:Protein of unknown function [Bacillus wiedmannii]|uniref:Uncharacterized protein n=1 Tax=Bacillus wiedmannii TaxID=1890302 RepID=A0A1C4CEV2_9BACI|nr:Protein of unknown function [Bacillus wiedmannii]
MKELKLSFDS